MPRDTNKSSPVSSLEEADHDKVLEVLIDYINNEEKSITAYCGGHIPITSSSEINPVDQTRRTSLPVRIYWHTEKTVPQALVLPLTDNNGPVQQLLNDCIPYVEGSGALFADKLASSFHPADFGILDSIQQILLPTIKIESQKPPGFQRVTAELCKLNVVSKTSCELNEDLGQKSPFQFGYLVVCLPSAFTGGKLTVQHGDGFESVFDWGERSATTIQWLAFYDDCDNYIGIIEEGYRVTLVYRLCVSETVGDVIMHRDPIIDSQSLPLYGYLRDFLGRSDFLQDGGVIGVYCTHPYPHNTVLADKLLPQSLEGSDLALFAIFKALGLETVIRPVMDGHYSDRDSDHFPLIWRLRGTTDVDNFSTEDYSIRQIIKLTRSSCNSRDVYWINDPRHTSPAMKIVSFHEKPVDVKDYKRLETIESSLAIFGYIPSWNERIFGQQHSAGLENPWFRSFF